MKDEVYSKDENDDASLKGWYRWNNEQKKWINTTDIPENDAWRLPFHRNGTNAK